MRTIALACLIGVAATAQAHAGSCLWKRQDESGSNKILQPWADTAVDPSGRRGPRPLRSNARTSSRPWTDLLKLVSAIGLAPLQSGSRLPVARSSGTNRESFVV
jgi:hypothetical protein